MKSDKFDFRSKPIYVKFCHALKANDAYVKFLYNFKRTSRYNERRFYHPNEGNNSLAWLLNDAFNWTTTAEGFDYWSNIAKKLRKDVY